MDSTVTIRHAERTDSHRFADAFYNMLRESETIGAVKSIKVSKFNAGTFAELAFGSVMENRRKGVAGVLESNGEPVAVSLWLVAESPFSQEETTAVNHLIYTSPHVRCRGYATQLTKWMEAEAAKIGVVSVQTAVDYRNRSSLSLMGAVGMSPFSTLFHKRVSRSGVDSTVKSESKR